MAKTNKNLGAVTKVASATSMNGALNAIKHDVLGGRPTRLAGGLTLNHNTSRQAGTVSIGKTSSRSGI